MVHESYETLQALQKLIFYSWFDAKNVFVIFK